MGLVRFTKADLLQERNNDDEGSSNERPGPAHQGPGSKPLKLQNVHTAKTTCSIGEATVYLFSITYTLLFFTMTVP